MKLIDEMREKAESFRETSPYDYGYIADQIRDWADRLERATILVAVPHGEACAIIDMETDLFIHEGIIHQVPEGEFYGVPIYDDRPHFLSFHGTSDTIVQPVALVPITEAEV